MEKEKVRAFGIERDIKKKKKALLVLALKSQHFPLNTPTHCHLLTSFFLFSPVFKTMMISVTTFFNDHPITLR